MRGFKMESSGDNIRYVFDCIHLKQSICSTSTKQGANSDHGDGDSHYIDRFPVDCSSTGYIYGFQFSNLQNGEGRYNVECCTIQSSWTSSVSCYTGSTPFSDNGGHNLHFLDRHQVHCNTGYALSYFRYSNNNAYTQFQLSYRCCRIYL